MDRRVEIHLRSGESVRGTVLEVADDAVVIADAEGRMSTVRKADAYEVRLLPNEPAPTPVAPTPPPPPPAASEPSQDASTAAAGRDEAWKPLDRLGVYVTNALAYARWSEARDGAAAYLLEGALGYNFSERVSLLANFGGVLGAKLVDGDVGGQLGHVGATLAIKRRFFAFMPGIGAGFSALHVGRGTRDARVDRDIGFVAHLRLMGVIPLPKRLFIGIGGGWTGGFVQGGDRVNVFALQVTFGHWR